jgi:hypothetical protein
MKHRSGKKKMTVIDAHNHINWIGMDARKLVENMDQFGIDKTWLLTWECPAHEIDMISYPSSFAPNRVGMPLEDMLHAVELYPDRLVPFYAPDPRDPFALDKLASAVEMHGIRGYGELKVRIMADDPDALRIYALCGELKLPVIFHIDVTKPRGGIPSSRQYWYCYDIDRLENALKLCPKTIFIGHAPGFWREISGDATDDAAYPAGPVKPGGKLIRLFDKYPNLCAELSANSGLNAIKRDREFGIKFLTKYQDRILFGRDGKDNQHQEYLNSLDLPSSVLEKVFHKNAEKLVPLK